MLLQFCLFSGSDIFSFGCFYVEFIISYLLTCDELCVEVVYEVRMSCMIHLRA